MAVLDALRKLPGGVKLRILGYETIGHPGYLKHLQRKADELGLEKRFEIIGEVSMRQDLFRWASQCHVGLAFMPLQSSDINEQNMTQASNKPFDYLACGLALLVSDLPDWKEMFVRGGYGLACDSEHAESIAGALGWFLGHPKEMREMGERGRQKILSEWNYDRQFQPILEVLNKSI